MPEIRIEAADGFKGRLPLHKERITIGRSRDSDIFLPDLWLSRHHAEIRRTAEGFFLRDLGSTNGTRLNGERIESERLLRPGDVITLAQYVLAYSEEETEDFGGEATVGGAQAFAARDISELGTGSGMRPVELARQQRALAILTRAATALIAPVPLEELYALVLDQIFEAVPAQRAAVALLRGTPPESRVVASRSRRGSEISRVSRSITRRVARDRVSLLIPKVLEDPAFAVVESIRASGIRSAMCAPLWITGMTPQDDAVIGLVYVDSLQDATTFTSDDLRILTALANLAAAKIEGARLQADRYEKRRMEDDLRRAAEIQSGLLPTEIPVLVGYEIVGCNQLGSAVGADYYDFLLHQGRLLLALGDVAGKGTAAALLMSLLRTSVRAHWADHPPGGAAARVNRTLFQSVPENRYATLFVASLEPPGGRLTYVNAGHYAPLLLRSDGDMARLERGGTILGMFPTAAFDEAEAEIRAGDTLIVFSDGVVEAPNASGEVFGEGRLVEVALEGAGSTAQAHQDAILAALARHVGSTPASDDRTLIVLKRLEG